MISPYGVMSEGVTYDSQPAANPGGKIPLLIDPSTALRYDGLSGDAGDREAACVDRCGIEHELAFGLVMPDDSMEPRVRAGDTVIFVPALEEVGVLPTDNAIVFVRFTPASHHEGITVATFIFLGQDRYLLLKENRAYSPRHVRRDDIAQLAVAVQRRCDSF